MRIMYVAPRYHTNQIPIMDGWIAAGDQVTFVSQYRELTEDYSVVTPIILGYSKVYGLFIKINMMVRKCKNFSELPFNIRARWGWPSWRKVKKLLDIEKPDCIIVRDRNVYNIPFYLLARRKSIPCILYNQTPLWNSSQENYSLIHKLYRRCFPDVRMTPVLGNEKKCKDENSYYIPFVMNGHVSPSQKEYFLNDKINILCVGKYETRKNHLMLLKALEALNNQAISVTIVGEVSTRAHEEYYKMLQEYIASNNCSIEVTMRKNLNQKELFGEYEKADLFVLPSTGEFASISQLEAMSFSLPVICSDTNGTACYVAEGENGYIFVDNDEDSLKNALETITASKEEIVKMGEKSFRLVSTKYSFQAYKEQIMKLIHSIAMEEE